MNYSSTLPFAKNLCCVAISDEDFMVLFASFIVLESIFVMMNMNGCTRIKLPISTFCWHSQLQFRNHGNNFINFILNYICCSWFISRFLSFPIFAFFLEKCLSLPQKKQYFPLFLCINIRNKLKILLGFISCNHVINLWNRFWMRFL